MSAAARSSSGSFPMKDTIEFCRAASVAHTTLGSEPLRCLVLAARPDEYKVVSYVSDRPYIAISYTWPSTGWSRLYNSNQPTTIIQQGRKVISIHVSKFAHMAIQSMLSNSQISDISFWVDHECINQSDNHEKDRQVAIMDKIYNRAMYTAILLEDIELSAEEFDFLNAARTHRDEPIKYGGLVKKILAARWFKRAWCSQEMILSRASIVFVHQTGNPDSPIQFSYWILAGWVTTAAIHDPSIKKLAEPRGISPSDCTLTMHAVAWAWGMLYGMECFNPYDKVSLVLNLTRAPSRLTNIPHKNGQSMLEDDMNIAKFINVLAILNGDLSLLLAGHSRNNDILQADGFGWAATPVQSDLASESWHPWQYAVHKDKMPRLFSSGLRMKGFAATVLTQETWCVWRNNGKLYARVNGMSRVVSSIWPANDEFVRNPSLHSLRDVLLAIAQLEARHLYRSFIHPDEDGKMTNASVEVGNLKEDIRLRFGRVTAFQRALAAQLNLLQDNKRIELVHLKLTGDHAVTAFGNITKLKGRTIFQPYGMRPLRFGDYLFTINALVLDGTMPTGNFESRKCIGHLRCFQMLPEEVGEIGVEVT